MEERKNESTEVTIDDLCETTKLIVSRAEEALELADEINGFIEVIRRKRNPTIQEADELLKKYLIFHEHSIILEFMYDVLKIQKDTLFDQRRSKDGQSEKEVNEEINRSAEIRRYTTEIETMSKGIKRIVGERES